MEMPPEPAPKRKARKAKPTSDDAFACDAPEALAVTPRKRPAAAKVKPARNAGGKERARP
jgi:hypothetical protein